MININLFPEKELDAMNRYVLRHASTHRSSESCRTDFKEILEGAYATAKENLYNMFGQKFILSKQVEFSVPEVELCDEMDTVLFSHPLTKGIRDRFQTTSWRSPEYAMWNNLCHLTYPNYLVNNKWDRDDIEFLSPKSGKMIKITRGMKITKALGKVAEAFDFPGYEDFLIKHSQVLNKKKLKGTLCLSIHPLDYMTMSDNDCDWSSCMSWAEDGCYRVGTVEMMNSPCVVVAYLKSDSDMYMPGGTYWSNKKWRCLMVVDEKFICSIKGYPYYHHELNAAAASWLAELYNKNCEGTYNLSEQPVECDLERTFINAETREAVYAPIYFTTHYMYNDFSCARHAVIVSAKGKEYTANFNSACGQTYNYSGMTQCVWCGEEFSPCDCEENLICRECGGSGGTRYCECGAELNSDEDFIYVDGDEYCPYCIDECCFVDPFSGDWRHNDDGEEIYLVWDAFDSDKTDSYEQLTFDPNGPWKDTYGLAIEENDDGYYYVIGSKSEDRVVRSYFSFWSNESVQKYYQSLQTVEN